MTTTESGRSKSKYEERNEKKREEKRKERLQEDTDVAEQKKTIDEPKFQVRMT